MHLRYGPQVHVVAARLERPSGRLIIAHLASHPAFDRVGIGRKKAERLWEAFGEGLYSVLSEGDAAKLVHVLTEETARKLIEAWRQTAPEAEMVQFLAHHGFDQGLANKVRRVWGADSIQKLQENPYRMMAFADFEKVDAMARSLGVQGEDPRRLVSAAEGCMYRRLDAKHTQTPEEDAVNSILALLKTQHRSEAQSSIERAVQDYAIVPYRGGYQPLGAAVMERAIADRFRAMIGGSTSRQQNLFSGSLETVIAEVLLQEWLLSYNPLASTSTASLESYT